MEKHVDEKILDYINAMEDKEQREDICAGPVKINNCFYQFEETEFYDGKLKMYIPKTFIDMDENARRFKYPSENRPEIIKCNDDGSITITLKIIDNPTDDENIENLKNMIKFINQKINPANIFFDDGIENVNDKNIGYFDFKSSALDDFLYNFIFIAEFKGKTLMGTFNCSYSEHKQWKDDIVMQLINTLSIEKEEQKNEC